MDPEVFEARNIQNVVAVTGDIHTFFAVTNLSPAVLAGLAAVNPHIKYYDFVHRGYGVIELGPTEAVCELKMVDALTRGASTPTTIAKFRVPPGARSPDQIA